MHRHHKTAAPNGSWGKRIGIASAALLALLAIFYLVGSRSAVIKAMVLARGGAALNAKVAADDVALSPFSQVHIRKLRVETTGTEPLVTADEARVRYSLMDIIGGHINVQELTLSAPVVTIVHE